MLSDCQDTHVCGLAQGADPLIMTRTIAQKPAVVEVHAVMCALQQWHAAG
jgi:hypothetical protein